MPDVNKFEVFCSIVIEESIEYQLSSVVNFMIMIMMILHYVMMIIHDVNIMIVVHYISMIIVHDVSVMIIHYVMMVIHYVFT